MHSSEPKQLYPQLYKILVIKATHDPLLRPIGGEDPGVTKHTYTAFIFSQLESVSWGVHLSPPLSGNLCALTSTLPHPVALFRGAPTHPLSCIPGSESHTAAAAWWLPYPQRDQVAHIPAAEIPPAGKGPKGSPALAPEKHKGKIKTWRTRGTLVSTPLVSLFISCSSL